ncbi:MAG TPA: lactate racemase domain-containing protein [Kiritimatiellia bacterium]|nr:lactate racemase domain-containing protein [Kiritimatiellia bacterium]HMP32784.1 lactate racemase domain-containing protein [Kiritimatiellia bacterium]
MEIDIQRICADAVSGWTIRGRRILLVVPDRTRTCPLAALFRVMHNLLAPEAACVDVMIALGTHAPLPEEAILAHLGITPEERAGMFRRVKLMNHAWSDPAQLTSVGAIPAAEIAALSGDRFSMEVEVRVNRAVRDYDLLVVLGPVFPHEVAGFSGGNKYFFPGISGPEVLNFFHWLGAVITNPRIIGHARTPVRAVIDRAAAMIPAERKAVCMVVDGHILAGLYAGEVDEAWSRAAAHSARLHVREVARPFHTVFAVCPPMYDELWTAGKCMYKSEPAVADGGRVIIYAPHLHEVCQAHGEAIFRIGYHTRDYFLKQWDRFHHEPWGVLAHSTHVKGIGTYENGVEQPRVEVILASRISAVDCRRLNLGYLDPDALRPDDYRNRESEGILFIPRAGELLYRAPAFSETPP